MPQSSAFDLRPTIGSFQQMGNDTTSLGRELSKLIRFDPDTGSVNLDIRELEALAGENLSEQVRAPFVYAMNDVALGGLAIFGSYDEFKRGEAIAIPWVVITDLVFSLRGAPTAIKSALGIENATNPDEVVQILHKNFQNVPNWILNPRITERFLRNPIALPGEGWGGSDDPGEQGDKPDKPTDESPKGWGGFEAPKVEDAISVAKCLVNGNWGPLGGQWWGWAVGWQVCLDQACADKVGKLLAGVGGGGALLKSIQDVINAETIAIGIKGLKFTAGMALAIYAFLLGANILAVNWANGVCIQGNWPVIGGPGAFVWAVAQ